MIFFGYRLYITALAKQGDILNGIIILLIGVALVATVVYFNVKNTSLQDGLGLSLLQAPIYSVLAVLALFVLIAMIAFFSETKPVYHINDD
ncbi:hypothetical protein PGH07_01175 [Sulfurovum sp. zt1-1]|uniref:Uncharacterized protein n=1 Tax=Sulfurovum zhangzhouensis TaxID=3019067 RepID=A0ABT7QVB2_9BACT|nr:hypothetical protein [Sulfurovum zhangzhouensis]MDM5270783.1 hypothetical protein [Sulfurovum zhangzhouensis]